MTIKGQAISIHRKSGGKEVSQTCCGADFREVCGKNTPDNGLNRARGFALQLAATHSSRPAVDQPYATRSPHTAPTDNILVTSPSGSVEQFGHVLAIVCAWADEKTFIQPVILIPFLFFFVTPSAIDNG